MGIDSSGNGGDAFKKLTFKLQHGMSLQKEVVCNTARRICTIVSAVVLEVDGAGGVHQSAGKAGAKMSAFITDPLSSKLSIFSLNKDSVHDN